MQQRRRHARSLKYQESLAELLYNTAATDQSPLSMTPSQHPTPSPIPSLHPLSTVPRAVRRLPLNATDDSTEILQPDISLQPEDTRSPGDNIVNNGLLEVQLANESYLLQNAEQSRYPTPPAAPPKDQYISESESSDICNRPCRRQPPAKLFRNGQLWYHKSYKGPEPIGYVDTGLYEGGQHDFYEAYNEADAVWAKRLSLVLRRHGIPLRRRALSP